MTSKLIDMKERHLIYMMIDLHMEDGESFIIIRSFRTNWQLDDRQSEIETDLETIKTPYDMRHQSVIFRGEKKTKNKFSDFF